ncbi:MAG: hypothetical protein LUE20_06950 [Oscillospiraceae bacterium]|nr:hypothetical protein [Oscillospiraceae bacterium]
MKKILAVATAIVLAISSLCVFVFADDVTTIYQSDCASNYYDYYFDDVSSLSYSSGDVITLTAEIETDGSSAGGQIIGRINGSWNTATSFGSSGGEALTASGSVYTVTVSTSVTATSTDDVTFNLRVYYVGGSSNYLTVKSVTIANGTTGESVTSGGTASGSTSTGTEEETEIWSTTTVDYCSDWSAWTFCTDPIDGFEVTTSWTQIIGSASTYNLGLADGLISAIQSGDYIKIVSTESAVDTVSIQCDSSWSTYYSVKGTTTYDSSTGEYTTLVSCADILANIDLSEFQMFNLSTSSGTGYLVSLSIVTVGGGEVGSNRTNGVIYINEDYHGILLTRYIDGVARTYLACVPHTVASNGYCTVCHMYIGTDDEGSTVTIDGIEYEAAYTVDVSLGSSNGWGQLDLGDTALIDALSTEGALLVITRDGVSDTVHNGSETYEKFGLVNSWWSGDWIALGTAGHTSATEDGVIDCISDDGTTAVYDGATVYAEWVSRGMNAGGTALLISNTSNTLHISNVTVYVPVGTIVAEDVDVEEPVESTDTETEEDGDDLTVDDIDEVETPAETNPTTGVALALVPMAIAGLAVVSSKRR